MKKILLIFIAAIIYQQSFSQFKINSLGMVDITAQTQDWNSGLKVTVQTYNSTAYNLWYNGTGKFFVHASGYLWCERGGYFGSDISLKENIMPIEGALEKVLKLQGVRYQYKDRTGEKENPENPESFRLGFIVQEVEKVFPEVTKDMPDGIKAMSYTDLIAVLVEALKEQQEQIEQLQSTVRSQNLEVQNLKEQIDTFSPVKSLSSNESGLQDKQKETTAAQLFQNKPNPFTADTEIQFDIPQNAVAAKLLIHDMQGAEIKSYPITAAGTGNILIQASELKSGMYMYTLLVNNTIVDTKKMILTK